MSDTTYHALHEYVHDWYDSLNDTHEHDMHEHMYAYLATISEFSDDTE